MPVSLSHLFVHVSDLERSRRFYVDVVGLELLIEHPGYLRLGGGGGFHMGLEERDASQVGAEGIEIVIEVDDVHETYGRMADAGVDFLAPPEAQAWGATHAWFTDPDGYQASIYSPS